MATAAQQANYREKKAQFSRKLQERGRQASFGRRSQAGDSWNPSGDYVETGTAFVFPSDWDQDFGPDVRSEDLMFFVSADVDVSECNVMIDRDIEYSIKTVKPFRPDVTVIFYEIQVRI